MAMVREKMGDALGRVFGDPQRSEGERSEPERSGGAPKTAASRDGIVFAGDRSERAMELWSWDITKLKGPAKWDLTTSTSSVILDVFSRSSVGWMLAYRESGALANRLKHAKEKTRRERRRN